MRLFAKVPSRTHLSFLLLVSLSSHHLPLSCALSLSRSFSKYQQPKGEGEKMDRGGGEDQDEVLLWCRSVFPHLNLPALGFGEYPRW